MRCKPEPHAPLTHSHLHAHKCQNSNFPLQQVNQRGEMVKSKVLLPPVHVTIYQGNVKY